MNPAAAARVTGFSLEDHLASAGATIEDRGSIYSEMVTVTIRRGLVSGVEEAGRRTIRLPPPPPPPPPTSPTPTPTPILNLNEDPEGWARVFAGNYYTTLDSDRGALAPLFQDGSMLTFQGHQILGAHDIMAKLASLPHDCHHIATVVDWQPSPGSGGMLVLVSGDLYLSREQQAEHKFTGVSIIYP